MAVSDETVSLDTVNRMKRTIRNKPIYQILIFEFVLFLIFMIFDPVFFRHFPTLLLILLFGPTIPALFVESSWEKITQDNNELTRLKEKADLLRPDFLLIGIVFSALFFFISKIHFLFVTSPLLTPFGTDFNRIYLGQYKIDPNLTNTLLYYLVFGFGIGIVCYKLYLVGYNQSRSKYNKFYDHPLIMVSHATYFLVGVMVIPLVMYPFQPVDVAEMSSVTPFISSSVISEQQARNFYSFNYYVFGLTTPILLAFPLFLIAAITLFAEYFPFALDGNKLALPKRDKIIEFAGFSILTIIIFALFTFIMLPNSDTRNLDALRVNTYLSLIILLAYTVYLINRNTSVLDLCNDCGFYGLGENCKYCNNRTLNRSTSLFGMKTKVPKCPNCDEIWNNLSRRCTNCQYTIVLTCDNCSQTINPLWRKCNLCGEPRQTVPEIALGNQPDTRFPYNRARYVALILLTIPFIILELILLQKLTVTYNAMLQTGQISDITVARFYRHDNIRRIIVWGVFVVAVAILIYRTSTADRKSHLLITDEMIRISYSEIVLLTILFGLAYSFRQILFGVTILSVISFLGIILVIAGYIYRRYIYLKDYEPIIVPSENEGGL